MLMIILIVQIFLSILIVDAQPTLSQPRGFLCATSIGNYAMFAGGGNTAASNIVDMWNNETNIWTTATLSQGRTGCGAASAGKLALFGGGNNGADSNVVDMYNITTNSWFSSDLT